MRIITRNCPHFEIEWFITDKSQNFTSTSKLGKSNIGNDLIFLNVEKTLMIIFIKVLNDCILIAYLRKYLSRFSSDSK